MHLPGVGAVALVSAIATITAGSMPTNVSVVLLIAAVGAGALSGGVAPAVSAGGVALPAWWYIGLPFDLFLFGAFLLGGVLLAMVGESVVRSRRRAADLAEELAVTRRRLVHEAESHRRAEHAEAALRHAQERFDRLVRSNVVPVVVTDQDGRCLDANPAFLELVGCEAKDLAGDAVRWQALSLPAERLLDERAAAEARTHGAASPYERTLVRADGRHVPVLVGALAIAPGEPALLWFVIDLGARQKLAEEQAARALLDVIFETAPVGLGLYDHELRFLRVNRRLAEINGLPPEAQLGRRLPEVLPELGPEVLEQFARVIETGESLEHAEAHGRTPASPDDRHFEVSYYPVRTPGAPFFSIAAIVYEVTDRRRAEEEREALLREAERARSEAELASRAKDEFLAVLSHELRAPLQGVLGWVTLLREGRLEASQQVRALQAIERSTRLQTQVINDLLDVSRIISGKLSVEARPLDVVGAVREAVERVRPAAAARGITLDASIADCGVSLGDAQRWQQVLGNLLSNAMKFTPPGGRISVRCEHAGEEIMVVVEDSGEGIAPEFLPHVFERFRQADASSSRRHGGLGLGLAIARRLVELQGGRIIAESEGVGRGARFTIHLPMHDPEATCPAVIPESPRGEMSGRHLLVVEDDPDSREAIALALELHGGHVRAAGSVDEALALVDGSPLDAVLSDLSMPGKDGYALLERLRARGVDAPVVAVSGFATPEDRERALAAGFSAHVAKPVDVDVLLNAVAKLLER
jgi:PAS domain S-box-containing protein